MEQSNLLSIVLVIMGSFLSMILMVNAFFTRQTLKEISEVKLRLVELIAKHDATSERALKNENEITQLRQRFHEVINNTVTKVELFHIEIEQIKKKLDL